jgi:hypothetical protein
MALSQLELRAAALRRQHHRIAELVAEIIRVNNAAVPAVYGLIAVATTMARHLPPATRTTIAGHMEHEATALRGRVH